MNSSRFSAALLLVAICICNTVAQTCEEGWVASTTGNNQCYFISTESATLTDARVACAEQSAQLLEIDDADENTFVLDQRAFLQCYWLGISDENKEGEFLKLSDGEAVSFINWPSAPSNNNKDCVYLKLNGEWEDSDCTSTNRYICEKSGIVEDTVETGCPTGWTSIVDKCYFLSADKMDWAEAAGSCTNLGSSLFSPRCAAEQTSVSGFVNEEYWIDATDVKSQGTWLNAAEVALTYVGAWATGQPENNKLIKQDCVAVNVDNLWYDDTCTSLLREKKFVCVKDRDATCQDGWTAYNGKCYLLVEEAKKWADAKLDCEGKADNTGSLVAPSTAEEVQKLKEDVVGGSNVYWIDFNDEENEGTWVNSNAEEINFAFYDWNTFQPTDQYWNWFTSQNCLSVEKNGKLNDWKCSSEEAYVCVAPPSQTTGPCTDV